MWTHKTLQQSIAQWDQTTPTLPTHPLKFHGGNSTFPTETPGDHLPEEEGEDKRQEPQGHHQEAEEAEAEEEEVEEEEEEVEEAEEEEGHSRYPDMHLPNQLKSS